MAGKIGMAVPLVEMDGDEMTRILWHMIREILIEPYVDLRTEYYDLGLKNRDETGDGVTLDAASAVRRLGVGVKCATITPNAQRMEEYGLREMWRSPNATIRAHLDGTIFRVPILAASIKPFVRTWKKPITIARHAYGDIYRGVEMRVPGKGQAHLVFTDGSGSRQRISVHDFEGPGVLMGMHNLDGSITSFARSCFRFALETKQDLWFSAKDTVSRIYDHRFKDIFTRIFEEEFKERFGQTGIRYFYTLIDDAAARVLGSEGGFIWACKNYDGDVMSDLVGGGFGSIAMMNSVLVSPEEKFVYEAAHGTVTKHYYEHLKGKFTSTNPMATLFAWTGALRKRGELDGCIELARFSERLERSAEQAINNGVMTGDLAKLSDHPGKRVVTSAEFLGEVRSRLEDPRTDV